MPSISILGPDGRPYRGRSRPAPPSWRELRARYDAAQESDDTKAHWANADGLSARAANSPEVRRKLRERARYEVANNSYASGIVETLANDVVGTGPRIQFLTDDAEWNKEAAGRVEAWSAAVGLAEKLRTYRESRAVDGESFLQLISNPVLPTPVTLDLQLIEADQVTTPDLWMADPQAVDGIRFDAYGNPAEYHVLDEHPGDDGALDWSNDYRRVPAGLVRHWFKVRRPGQRRGVPEITPALPLFALMRRYTLATVTAAEIAALFAVLLKSTLPPDDDTAALTPFDSEQLTRGMMTTLPDGYEAQQMKPDHPATTYPAFKRELINEVARCLNIPYNIAAGNSSEYNYASGRLDHQTYYRSVGIDQYFLETAVLDRVLLAWLEEARLAEPEVFGALPRRMTAPPRHQWFWDGQRHVDPTKEATAQETRLRNGTTTLADEWASEGFDWREKADQQAEERRYYAALGIPHPGDRPESSASQADRAADAMEGAIMTMPRIRA